jgi:hypothetical protein
MVARHPLTETLTYALQLIDCHRLWLFMIYCIWPWIQFSAAIAAELSNKTCFKFFCTTFYAWDYTKDKNDPCQLAEWSRQVSRRPDETNEMEVAYWPPEFLQLWRTWAGRGRLSGLLARSGRCNRDGFPVRSRLQGFRKLSKRIRWGSIGSVLEY